MNDRSTAQPIVDAPRPARRARLFAALAIAAAFLALALLDAHAFGPPAPSTDYSKFSHTNGHHARVACLLCHRRPTNAARPSLPGHSPCAGCHAQQFADPASPICTICHTDAKTGAVKAFPGLRSFNVTFDHSRHMRGAARARDGCATCHKPERNGVSLSIPSGVQAHSVCYQCHTNRATAGGRDISSCGVCHRIGRYARTPEFTVAYKRSFDHGKHASSGLACNECHDVRAGAARSRQVTSPFPAQHHAPQGMRSCATCHDNKRAFGGDDFSDCTRCHTGDTWHF